MSEFQELIKNFHRIRDYMRQFFVYGYKSRSDYEGKSARTYDNERRRIESWLSGCIQSGYTQKEKHVYISVDSKTIPQNPLYAAWKSKSFTDNDILLHFFLPDLLWEHPEGMTSGELCDAMSAEYGMVFDSQTVRLKLKEYERLGFLESQKQGKRLCYRLLPGPIQPHPQAILPVPRPDSDLPGTDKASLSPETNETSARYASLRQQTWQSLLTAVTYFQEAAPFGFIGSTILDHENLENQWFSFKHHFLVHTLEDGVLADILAAMKEHRSIAFENTSSRSGATTSMRGLPLKIFVSTQTGRRYLCLYLEERRRFTNVRLDAMAKVVPLDICGSYEHKQQLLSKNLPSCWGVSFGGSSRMEEIHIKIFLNEEKEAHILNRLYREGRGGELLKIRDHEYLYSGAFFDTNEMLAWIKTFTGRILDIQGTNSFAVAKITRDFEKMYEMYEQPASLRRSLPGSKPNRLTSDQPTVSDVSSRKSACPQPQELFEKIYGCYYQAVRRILLEAAAEPVSKNRIRELSMKYGYSESSLTIVPKLTEGGWPLLKETDSHYRPVLLHPELLLPGGLPLTLLQKSWLKALLSDRRMRLFITAEQLDQLNGWLSDTEPLYRQEDFYYFDQYLDGDDYTSSSYQDHFQTILRALTEKKALILVYENRRGQRSTLEAAPYQLQYSSKDDKFRLCCLKYSRSGFSQNTILNLSRIKACHLSRKAAPEDLRRLAFRPIHPASQPVVIRISGERNSLERCMLHFANYEKHTRYEEETKTWLCSIYYDLADETELLIELLSFGPVIQVLGPESFLRQIRCRVQKQHELFYRAV